MSIAACLSTGKDDWETPDDLFAKYDAIYHFVLDAAADEHNHKCATYFGSGGVEPDALTANWGPWLLRGNVWLNPPYGRGLQDQFVRKAVRETLHYGRCGMCVCLLPARTDTKLFHDIIKPFGDIEFLEGRVKFKGATQGAPFPSMIVVFQ